MPEIVDQTIRRDHGVDVDDQHAEQRSQHPRHDRDLLLAVDDRVVPEHADLDRSARTDSPTAAPHDRESLKSDLAAAWAHRPGRAQDRGATLPTAEPPPTTEWNRMMTNVHNEPELIGFELTHSLLRAEIARLAGAFAAGPEPADIALVEDHLRLVAEHLVRHHEEEDSFHWPLLARRAPEMAEILSQFEDEHATFDAQLVVVLDQDAPIVPTQPSAERVEHLRHRSLRRRGPPRRAGVAPTRHR